MVLQKRLHSEEKVGMGKNNLINAVIIINNDHIAVAKIAKAEVNRNIITVSSFDIIVLLIVFGII